MDSEVPDPAGDPNEFLVGAYRPVDQHDGRRPGPITLSRRRRSSSTTARSWSTVFSATILKIRNRPSSKLVQKISTWKHQHRRAMRGTTSRNDRQENTTKR